MQYTFNDINKSVRKTILVGKFDIQNIWRSKNFWYFYSKFFIKFSPEPYFKMISIDCLVFNPVLAEFNPITAGHDDKSQT